MSDLKILKFTGEKTYCPNCCIVEWRTKNKIYPGFLGFAKVKEVDYLYSTPKYKYPKQLENARGDTFCGNCNRQLGIIIHPRTKKEQKEWLKKKN